MRATRDSFLTFLSANLTDSSGVAIPVHALRRDPDNPNTSLMKVGSVNINFLEPIYSVRVSDQQAIIDVVNDYELIALDWCTQFWKLISAAAFIPKLDYSQTPPAATGSNIYWSVTGVKFRPVHSDFYFHYTCTLPLHHRVL